MRICQCPMAPMRPCSSSRRAYTRGRLESGHISSLSRLIIRSPSNSATESRCKEFVKSQKWFYTTMPANDALERTAKPASSLRYPVIFLSRTMGVSAAESPSYLNKVSGALFWKARFFEGLRIVDATGQAHEVVSAVVRKPETAFGRRLARLFDTNISVEAETRPIGQISLVEIVGAVKTSIDEEPELFEELTGRGAASTKQTLARCANVGDIARLLASGKIGR